MKPLLLSLGIYLVLFLCPFSSNAGEDFVVHEWGTFTSVQASDGQLLYWNSLNPSDLPAFVYNRTQGQADRELNSLFAFGGKFNLSALHRMETPVLYFYSPTQRKLDVTVKFPQGLITEWYPQVRQFGPIYTTNESRYLNPGQKAESFVKWEQVEILPAATHPVFENGLPKSHAPSHYFAARNTDADFVRVSKTIKGDKVREFEKFLFYRGLGNFPAPLQLRLNHEKELELSNRCDHPLADLYVFNLKKGVGTFTHVTQLEARDSMKLKVDLNDPGMPRERLLASLTPQVEKSLIHAGLFPKEASAMVDTWKDSWFEEEGFRVFYILPQSLVDAILPLEVKPAPREVRRVFVGRAEMITPAMEWQALRELVHFSDEPRTPGKAVAALQNLGMGRFTPVVLQYLMGKNQSSEFQSYAWQLHTALSHPDKSPAIALK